MKKLFTLSSLYALISGASLTLAFAPFNLPVFAFIAPAILLGLSLNTTPSLAAWRGGLFGTGFFACSVSWVFVSIHTFGGTNSFLAALLTALFVMVLSLFIAGSSFLFRCCTPSSNLIYLITFPLSWVLSEILRTWIGSGFPWVLLGYSQLSTPLHNLAPLISVYGLSFLTAFAAALTYLICYPLSSWKRRFCALLGLGLLFGSGFIAGKITWTHPTGEKLTLSLIQGSIAQEMKWNPDYFDHIITTYDNLTNTQLGQDLIILPEGAIPAPSFYLQDYFDDLAIRASNNNSTIIFGTILSNADGAQLYNGMIMLGKNQGQYAKRHLVPFGEYLPLEKLRGLIDFFNIPMSNLSAGAKNPALFKVKNLTLAPSICYEIAYPNLIWPQASRSNILINISDDSWFGHSIASAQQLQISEMRAIETGRPIILVNNVGITGIISAEGKLILSLPPYEEGILRTTIQGYTGNTPIIHLATVLFNHRK